jgi:Putative bacterial sensory transduction regulator
MRQLNTVIAALAIAAAGIAPATAADPTLPNATMMIDSISQEILVDTLRDMGVARVETSSTPEGVKVVTFWDNNFPYNVVVGGCGVRPGKCITMGMFVRVDAGAANYPLETINAHNRRSYFAGAARLTDTQFGIGRAAVIDGGVTRLNVAMNLASFVGVVQDSMQFLAQQTIASTGKDGTAQLTAAKAAKPQIVPATPEDFAVMAQELSKPIATTLTPRK